MPTKTPKKKAAKKAVKTPKKLSPEQALFCILYTGHHNRDLFGNASRCYLQAYGHGERIEEIRKEIEEVSEEGGRGYTARLRALDAQIKSIESSSRTRGSQLLTISHIRGRIDSLMDSMISDDFNDREMQFVISQRYDLASKVAAIREYNSLKKRITKDPPATVGPVTINIAPSIAAKLGLT